MKKTTRKVFKIVTITAAFLVFLIFILMRWVAPKFQMSEAKQTAYLTERGQIAPTFGTYPTDDHRTIHYTHVGDTSKPLVVFVHGSPGSSDAFVSYLADTSLTAIAQLISVDRPGFGESDYGNAEPSMEKQAAYLQPLVEQFGKGKKVILVGHSLGGPVIARMAMDYGDLLSGLVIVAGSLDPDLEPKEWFRPYLKIPPFRWFLNGSFVASNDEIMPHRSELEKMRSLWEKIRIPVTVIQGTKDSFVPKGNADFAKKMLINSSDVQLRIIEKADHFLLWTQPELTTNAIFDLLRV